MKLIKEMGLKTFGNKGVKMLFEGKDLPSNFKGKIVEIFGDSDFKVRDIHIDKYKKIIVFEIEDCFTGWDEYDNRGTIHETFEMKISSETYNIRMEIMTRGYLSLKRLIEIFNELELLIRNNIEKLGIMEC